MKKDKVLIVTTVPETIASILRGQPKFLNDFFEVYLVSSPEAVATSIEEKEGIKIKFVKMKRGIHPLSDLLSILQMIFVLVKIKPDVVHSYTPKAGLVAMIAAFICRIPVRIHTFTGLIFPTQSGFKKKILIFVDRLICACATSIVPEGRGVKNDLQKFGITKKPLRVLGHGNIAGVNTEFFRRDLVVLDSAKTLPFFGKNKDEQSFCFCYIGRLNKDKGIEELALAFYRMPGDVRLILAGGIDATAPVASMTMERLKADSRVQILGHVPDVRPTLALADVLILPSYREGFPNVILQAGAMEVPVIATNVNGSNEIVEPGYNGWIVPAKNDEALYKAMQGALETSPEELQKMGERARMRVKERFEQGDHWKRLVDFYNEKLLER